MKTSISSKRNNSSLLLTLGLIWCLLTGLIIHVDAQNSTRVNPRGGLTNFYQKVSQGDTIRIAYLGGSITAAPGWRVKSFKWIKEQHPQCHFIEINATLGGTGSDLGAFRLANDVLKHKPDLIFVEFAVNDFSTNQISIEKQYEGIVRQIWRENTSTDICFVYTIMEKMISDYSEDGMSGSVKAAEAIADYYSIPTVNFAYEVLQQIKQKKLTIKGPKMKDATIKSFSPDGVHPYVETGHEIYYGEFKKFFSSLSELKRKKKKERKLKKPHYGDNWENAKILNTERLSFSSNWKRADNNSLYQTTTPGASVHFSFKGTMLGIKDVIGPQGCKLDIIIDGKNFSKLRFDKYCTYNRTHYLFIPGLKDEVHNVEIKLSDPLSIEEKINILKIKTTDGKKIPENMEVNRFSLKEIMVLEE